MNHVETKEIHLFSFFNIIGKNQKIAKLLLSGILNLLSCWTSFCYFRIMLRKPYADDVKRGL